MNMCYALILFIDSSKANILKACCEYSAGLEGLILLRGYHFYCRLHLARTWFLYFQLFLPLTNISPYPHPSDNAPSLLS